MLWNLRGPIAPTTCAMAIGDHPTMLTPFQGVVNRLTSTRLDGGFKANQQSGGRCGDVVTHDGWISTQARWPSPTSTTAKHGSKASRAVQPSSIGRVSQGRWVNATPSTPSTIPPQPHMTRSQDNFDMDGINRTQPLWLALCDSQWAYSKPVSPKSRALFLP